MYVRCQYCPAGLNGSASVRPPLRHRSALRYTTPDVLRRLLLPHHISRVRCARSTKVNPSFHSRAPRELSFFRWGDWSHEARPSDQQPSLSPSRLAAMPCHADWLAGVRSLRRHRHSDRGAGPRENRQFSWLLSVSVCRRSSMASTSRQCVSRAEN